MMCGICEPKDPEESVVSKVMWVPVCETNTINPIKKHWCSVTYASCRGQTNQNATLGLVPCGRVTPSVFGKEHWWFVTSCEPNDQDEAICCWVRFVPVCESTSVDVINEHFWFVASVSRRIHRNPAAVWLGLYHRVSATLFGFITRAWWYVASVSRRSSYESVVFPVRVVPVCESNAIGLIVCNLWSVSLCEPKGPWESVEFRGYVSASMRNDTSVVNTEPGLCVACAMRWAQQNSLFSTLEVCHYWRNIPFV